MKPYLTKIALGRWWTYVDTRRKYRMRAKRIFGWHFVIVSYRKRNDDDA